MDFRDHLVFSERQITQAEAHSSILSDISLYLIPSILLSWIAIEAFVNSVIDDLNQVPAGLFSLHERAFLLEKRVMFCEKGRELGKFMIDKTSEYRRLEDKIFFLIAKFGKIDDDFKGKKLWQEFEKFREDRNYIVHPRRSSEFILDIEKARHYLSLSKDIISLISKHVWKKKIEF
jgi:hypothetical protein